MATSTNTKALSEQVNKLGLEEIRELIGDYLIKGQAGGQLWDLMGVVRGPDFPSERVGDDQATRSVAYAARRARKAATGEVLRAKLFGGKIGGGARYRTDRNYVTLPPEAERDHYDRHVDRAAKILGIEVKEAERVGIRVGPQVVDLENLTPDQKAELIVEAGTGKGVKNFKKWGIKFTYDGYAKTISYEGANRQLVKLFSLNEDPELDVEDDENDDDDL